MDKALRFQLQLPPHEVDLLQERINECVRQELIEQGLYKPGDDIAGMTVTRESVVGQTLDTLAGLIISIGGGVGLAAIIVGIAKAIATVRDKNPNGKFKLTGQHHTLELDGYSPEEIADIIQNIDRLPLNNSRLSQTVEGFQESDKALLEKLYDPLTGEYSVPSPSVRYKDPLPPTTLPPNASRSRVAIVDTGVMTHHPWIRGKIKGYIDYTGEGIEDRNGHGTLAALQCIAGFMSVEGHADTLDLLIAKILDTHKKGTEDNLMSALVWAANNGAQTINLSLGIYRDDICGPGCELCSLVEQLSKGGITIMVAAGNDPARYTCPQARDTFTLKVGAANHEGSSIEGYSGPGAIMIASIPILSRLTDDDN